jgi:hypothetical protein
MATFPAAALSSQTRFVANVACAGVSIKITFVLSFLQISGFWCQVPARFSVCSHARK